MGFRFDAQGPARSLIEDCVHCGFCLPACPTYALWGEEMDSPRGRIHLMKQGREGALLGEAFVGHIDRCLGCMACVPACPSGVRYGQLVESARAQVERAHRRPLLDRWLRGALFAVLPNPGRLRVARAALSAYQSLGLGRWLRRLGLLALLPQRLRALEALAPGLPPERLLPPETPAAGVERRRAGLLTGCVQQVFFSEVNAATARVLAAEGCAVRVPENQGCCGALSLHAGRLEEARALARRTIEVFEAAGVGVVAVNAAGCGSALKEYGQLLAADAAYAERARRFASGVRDLSELLVEMGPVAQRHPLQLRLAYHDACHLAHAQGIRSQPRRLLRAIPGLELCEIEDGEMCCGSAGVYNILEPEAARELGERKARNLLATRAEGVVTANPGCLLQIRASLARQGRSLRMLHVAEVLDASIRGEGLPASLARP